MGNGPKAREHRVFLDQMFTAHPDVTIKEREFEQELLIKKAKCVNDFVPGNPKTLLSPYADYFKKLLDNAFGWDFNDKSSKLPAVLNAPSLNITVLWNPARTYPFTDVDLGESVLWWQSPESRLTAVITRELKHVYSFTYEQTNVEGVAIPDLIPNGMVENIAEFVRRFPLSTL